MINKVQVESSRSSHSKNQNKFSGRLAERQHVIDSPTSPALLGADGYTSIVCVEWLVQLMTQARMATESLEVWHFHSLQQLQGNVTILPIMTARIFSALFDQMSLAGGIRFQ